MNGVRYTLVYDWHAICRLAQELPEDLNLFDPESLSVVLEIGLARHHPAVDRLAVFRASPLIGVAVDQVNKALEYAYYGHRRPEARGNQENAAIMHEPRIERLSSAYAMAFAAGIRPEEFWSLTPFQTTLLVEAHAKSLREGFERMIVSAWYSALFERAKTLPPLNSLFPKQPDVTRINDDDDPDQIAAKQMMSAFLGATKAKSISTLPVEEALKFQKES